MTIAEKIISAHCGKKVRPGDLVLCEVDLCFGQDGTSNLIIERLEELNANKLKIRKAFLVIDHNSPPPNADASNIHKRMRQFAERFNLRLFDVGEGVCHQVVLESGEVLPSRLILGADSHTTTHGALNTFSAGIGSTDAAICFYTGKLWLKTPPTIRIEFEGTLNEGVEGKDIALYLLKILGLNRATYKALEFGGKSLKELPQDFRFTISNMSVEAGAKAAIFEYDSITESWIKTELPDYDKYEPIFPDKNAEYLERIVINLSEIEPMVSIPHSPANVKRISELRDVKIDIGFIGTCTNGRLEDLRRVAKILKGKKIKRNVRLIIVPASKRVFERALKEGLIEIFLQAGAVVFPPGCGVCVGAHGGVPADRENVISASNRNFKGRMGNPNSFIYLSSPSTVAASCIEGKITDPRNFL